MEQNVRMEQKQTQYRELAEQLRALTEGEPDQTANLANASAAIA